MDDKELIVSTIRALTDAALDYVDEDGSRNKLSAALLSIDAWAARLEEPEARSEGVTENG